MKHDTKSVIEWAVSALHVSNVRGDEVQASCPNCGYKNFYFNARKQIGICHKASCGYKPTLQDLIELTNTTPDRGVVFLYDPFIPTTEGCSLPGGCEPVISIENDNFNVTFMAAYKYLRNRNITMLDMLKFNIQFDLWDSRVYVPVYEKSTLVNYVSRSIAPKGKSYRYVPGKNIGNYLFGFDESRYWNSMVLVENTFVSIWLRSKFHCSTAFGSNISKVQARKIASSNIKHVTFLWDEGTDKKVENAMKRLNALGVSTSTIKIKGQPDDYTIEQLVDMGVPEA